MNTAEHDHGAAARRAARVAPRLLAVLLASCAALAFCIAPAISGRRGGAPRVRSERELEFSGDVSPDGRLVLAQVASLPQDVAADEIPGVVIDWRTGRIVGERRIPVGEIIAWPPRDGSFVSAEIPGHGRSRPLVCRQVPGLSKLWQLIPSAPGRRAGAWSLDGERFFAAVGPPGADRWYLVAVSRSGHRRVLARACTWLPRRVVRYHGKLAIVCSSAGGKPVPLTLLRLDGSVAGELGPALPQGAYFLTPSLDRFAWQGLRGCFLITREAGHWRRTTVKIPAAPGSTVSRLLASGDSHLMLLQNTRPPTVWAVDWAGRLRKLRLPRLPLDQPWPYPWIDGRHLIRAIGDRLELIDGYSGRVVRSVPVRLPGQRPRGTAGATT